VRPIRLQLKGFTAFRDEQAIDFSGLDLFAISGPTGSGKSSILDAITYALFGYVERVGRQVGQLVSQGQPRMAVTFEFAVGDERYRVTRSTPSARGQTKILLERREGGEWRQAGEGADRVREADAMIRAVVGLDYEAFTRSVLLPQGEFAEFLVGEARDRRAILTELLGLELFERLAKRAGEMRREAQLVAETDERLLQTEYEGVTPEALERTQATATEAGATETQLAAAERAVQSIAERWREIERAVADLVACAEEARDLAGAAASARASLEGLAERAASGKERVASTTKAAKAAAAHVDRARGALAKAEAEWGSAVELATLAERARGVEGRRAEAAAARERHAAFEAAVPLAETAVKDADAAVSVAVADAESALAAFGGANDRVREAEHADHVAAVVSGLHVGDPCPVCGTALAALPKAPGARALERARAEVGKAESLAKKADEALRRAQAELGAAEAAKVQAERELDAARAEFERRGSELAALERELAEALGGVLPDDPAAAIGERLDALRRLADEVEVATADAAEIKDAAVAAERELQEVSAAVATARAKLEGLPAEALRRRAEGLASGEVELPPAPVLGRVKDAAVIEALAEGLCAWSERLSDDLGALAERRASAEADLLRAAETEAGELVASRGSLEALVEDVATARRDAAVRAATAANEADALATKLENAGRLLEEVAAQGRRAERFHALSLELRADRIIAFLQMEALQVLASAGSDRLAALSSARYRLEYVEDEFFVVDTWNGEERRSAKTLSGGETFLASLALALALSEQVRSLSVTEKARLDSLFLDEGFGTLDPETLEVVVEAIEQLGGDGRMVGVITHVQELAIRLPARIDVEKSPRGSRLLVLT